MKEIKFRAWIKPDNGIQYYPGMYSVLILGPTACNVKRASAFAQAIFPLYAVELMQYTGLKDKNGKEIYEGDILHDDTGSKYEIVYVENLAQFLGDYGDCDFALSMYEQGDNEIIGNIYENSELLS